MLRSLVGGSLLLPGIISELLAAQNQTLVSENPLAPRAPHFPAKAKRVIFLYMSGGVSHVDSFDPKPKLISNHGKKTKEGYIKRPNWDFAAHGKSGLEVSELFPHVAECADDLCVIRSMRGDHGNHFEATLGIHTGSVTFARPSIGSWVSYGLGTVNQNLPSFVVIAPYLPYAGTQVFANDFLPAYHQGTRVIPGKEPVPNVKRQEKTADLQEMELGFAEALN